MRIPNDIALWLQETLHEYDGERWGMVDFALGTLSSSPAYTVARWQLGVDVIYRTLTCGLIGVEPFLGRYDKTSFLHAIRTLSPYEHADAAVVLWNGTRIYGTERLRKLFDAHFSPSGGYDGKLNLAFIEALEQNFAENGLPWSDKPLLPITPAAVNAEAPAPR